MKKQTKNKNKRFLNVFGLTLAALILSVLPISMLVNASSADEVPVLTRTAILRAPGGAINPHAKPVSTFTKTETANSKSKSKI